MPAAAQRVASPWFSIPYGGGDFAHRLYKLHSGYALVKRR